MDGHLTPAQEIAVAATLMAIAVETRAAFQEVAKEYSLPLAAELKFLELLKSRVEAASPRIVEAVGEYLKTGSMPSPFTP